MATTLSLPATAICSLSCSQVRSVLTTFPIPLSSLSSHRRELFPPQMGCPFQSSNSTRCKLFSRMPSTNGIMHPIWGALLSPATRHCYGQKRAPLSNLKPSASNACPLPSLRSPALNNPPIHVNCHRIGSALFSPATKKGRPQATLSLPATEVGSLSCSQV